MSSLRTESLFKPLQLKSLSLKNRIVMAPMTRNFSPEGVPDENVASYYRRRAEAEVGLILSEGTVIDRPASRNRPAIPFFHGDDSLAGWKRVIDGVHAAGGKMGPQIWHVGAISSGATEWAPDAPFESPSAVYSPGKPHGVAMTDEDIADAIAAYGRAAGAAKRLGFDTVEIHGAHGYLIDQFFWAGTNVRNDRFGGATLKQRVTFAAEVIKSVRAAVGEDFPVILRISQWKLQDYNARLAETPDAMRDWLGPLVEAGADALHCSQRRFWDAEFPDLDGKDGLNFAGWAKKLTGAVTISVGSVGLSGDFLNAFKGERSRPASLDNLIQRLERNEFDLIAVGRALLNDARWAIKIRDGDHADLKDFTSAAFRDLR
ncbi:NADH:flavin oxidoreductase [Dyella flava]|uniref:NADH:flavin oxidoreductase n=1 Tax=Dyella flava TaxID=1920170 RepID=A0ABS2K0S1_9GAMM|nr:NADH:flavin oxidoreductase [Dyella flava]